MKRETILVICCSLGAAGALFAQQPDEQPSPNKGPHGGNKSQTTNNESQQGATKTKTGHRNHDQQTTGAQQKEHEQGTKATTQENREPGTAHGARNHQNANAESNAASKTENANATSTNGTTAEQSASPGREEHGDKNAQNARKGHNARNAKQDKATANASSSVAPSTKASTANGGTTREGGATTNTTATQTNEQSNVAATTNTNVANGGRGRRVDQQKVQQVKQEVGQIRQQHASFHAQARPDRAPAVSFSANYRIQGAERWSGPRYEVFRSYHPQWHDQGWYHQHYQRVELIGGGYYYWNNGYWYPAWGYDQGNQYYAYDGPIYVGHSATPPDQVIASVQTELQQMGYYTGEVDGLLGPLTREALTAYQEDQGLDATAAIDEPTLDSLGMAS